MTLLLQGLRKGVTCVIFGRSFAGLDSPLCARQRSHQHLQHRLRKGRRRRLLRRLTMLLCDILMVVVMVTLMVITLK